MPDVITSSFSEPMHPDVVAGLTLSAAEQACLARQGFVTAEVRGPGRVYFKLRFRDQSGRQRVKYLGRSADQAARVADYLRHLQTGRRAELNLKQHQRVARDGLREAKSRLAPLLHAVGLAFHGFQIRRSRRCR